MASILNDVTNAVNHHVNNLIMGGGVIGTCLSSVWGFLGDNHEAIASCGVITSVVIAYLGYKRNPRQEQASNDKKNE